MPKKVHLKIKDHYVTMDNGILKVKISKPDGIVTRIKFNGIKNLLEERNVLVDRGYWDVVWSPTQSNGTDIFERIIGTDFEVITKKEEVVELSFRKTWDPSLAGKLVPLNIDKRFIMLLGSSGFYTYAIYEKLSEWPGFNLPQTRIAFKLSKDWFHYMAVSDNRQRAMPLPDDRLPERCEPLAYPEAVLLTDPIEEQFKGEVDDKYQYSCNNEELNVHGWICTDHRPTGFWQITPSNEFRSGGPTKQNLTSHVGPTNLAMFYSCHYVGEGMTVKFADGEYWKRVFGPVFMYVNSVPKGGDWRWLWEDAKEQWVYEVESWPYWFPASKDFPSSDQRGSVSGRLLISDSYASSEKIPAKEAYVGLAPPGESGSWQFESKGYQFWIRADTGGYFWIPKIREGDYNLFAWVPGYIGEYRYENKVSIIAGGDNIELGELVFEPPRSGPTLWEIGFPDRNAQKFFIPDPDPMYVNKLFVDHPDRYRQYGLWDRYTDLYPDNDLVYTVGVSDYQKDWFFAQVNRRKIDGTYVETTWQIKFKLDKVNPTSTYTLQLSIASSCTAELQVRVNNPNIEVAPEFNTGQRGKDNSIARHGIHGIYRVYSATIAGEKLLEGDNTLYLRQARGGSPFIGILYDYIRLEGPPVDA